MSARLAFTLEMHRVPQAPLARAVADHRFGMTCSDHPRDNLSRTMLAALPEPHLIVLAANEPPTNVACARNLKDWRLFSVIQTGPEDRTDYQRVANLVPAHRRVLLIETLPHLAATWLAFLADRPLLDLAPGRGEP